MSDYKGGPIAFLEQSGTAVYFSKAPSTAGTSVASSGDKGTAIPIKKLQNALDVAFWGEDNRFPQNIEQQMAYCGIGKYGLDRKKRKLWGNGIIPGRITGVKDDGSEIFTPLQRIGADKSIYDFIENRRQFRFWMEYLQDWAWFGNTFPEVLLSLDCKTITGLVHQESCDSRFKQMDDTGKIDTMFLSKMWGMSSDQFAKFDPKKTMRGLMLNPQNILEVDNKFVKALDCIDMYDPVESLNKIVEKLKGNGEVFKSAILPVNYPSVNKTYYQIPTWDGARLGGWVQIASKIPSMILMLYERAWNIKYHVEVPESFFGRRYGIEAWDGFTTEVQVEKRKVLLKEMDDALSGDKNAYKSFLTFYEIGKQDNVEYGRIKITAIDNKTNIDKDLITSSAADMQILIAMGQNPSSSGAGKIGSGQQRSGGSDIREADLVETSLLNLERNVFLEPLYLVRDFNAWDSDIVFRAVDTVLTTLDTGAGTTKKLS